MARQAVNLEINARDRTRRAFETASRRIDHLTGGATKLNRLFASGLGIATVGVAVGTAVQAVRRLIGSLQETVDRLDEIDKASRAAGIDGETLQSWRLFGQLAGATASQIDTSLRRIRRRTGEALLGGEVAKSFEALGISMGFLRENSENVGRIVLEIADRLDNAKDRTTAFAAAVRIGDIEFARFAQGLIDSGADFEEMERRWRALGIIIPNDVLPAVTDAKDRMTELTAAIRTQKDLFLLGLTPALESALGIYLIWSNRLKRILDYYRAINLAVQVRGGGLEIERQRETGTTAEGTALPGFAKLAQRSADEAGKAIRTQRLTYDLFLAEQDRLVDELVKNLRSPFEVETEELLGSMAGRERLDREAGGLFDNLQGQEDATRAVVQANTERLRLETELVGLSGVELTQARQRAELAALDRTIQSEINPLVREDLENQRAALVVYHGQVLAFQKQTTELDKQVQAANALSYIFSDLSDTTEGWLRFLAEGASILAQFGGFRGFFDAITGRGGETPEGRWRGGPVSPATPYIVGERGPELYIPRLAGNIVPNGQLGRSVTQNVALNVNAPISQREFNAFLLRSGPIVRNLLRDIEKRGR